ncbi:MAG: diaminopimelate epimerase [Flavobacteriales bacterium]|jgi:diaminopimelate epimerase
MQTTFYKYQGTGNDFILFDNRLQSFDKKNTKRIQELCDRKFGIGSDGLMLLEGHSDRDFNLVFYNPDGSQSFCGNGTRCAVALANQLGIIADTGIIEATDGTHEVKLTKGLVSVHMHDVSNIVKKENGLWLDTGSPHYIEFVRNVYQIDVVKRGREIRYDTSWGDAGTNVNFVEIAKDQLKIRTYERGVENETLSCGTGVTAAAIAAHFSGKTNQTEIKVKTLGGTLHVSLSKSEDRYNNIWLKGPAVKVFEGVVSL